MDLCHKGTVSSLIIFKLVTVSKAGSFDTEQLLSDSRITVVKLVSDLMSSYQTALSVGIKTSLSLVDHDSRSWEINVDKG